MKRTKVDDTSALIATIKADITKAIGDIDQALVAVRNRPKPVELPSEPIRQDNRPSRAGGLVVVK